MARTHLRVKDLIKQLQKMPPDAKVVFLNSKMHIPGMYYVTRVDFFPDPDEPQVEIQSNYATRALGWDEISD